MAALRLWLFFPLNVVLTLDPSKLSHYVEIIAQRFPLPTSYAEQILRELGPPHPPPAALMALERPEPDWPAVQHSIAQAIQLAATPQRTDRLFPGDIETFRSGGPASVAVPPESCTHCTSPVSVGSRSWRTGW